MNVQEQRVRRAPARKKSGRCPPPAMIDEPRVRRVATTFGERGPERPRSRSAVDGELRVMVTRSAGAVPAQQSSSPRLEDDDLRGRIAAIARIDGDHGSSEPGSVEDAVHERRGEPGPVVASFSSHSRARAAPARGSSAHVRRDLRRRGRTAARRRRRGAPPRSRPRDAVTSAARSIPQAPRTASASAAWSGKSSRAPAGRSRPAPRGSYVSTVACGSSATT